MSICTPAANSQLQVVYLVVAHTCQVSCEVARCDVDPMILDELSCRNLATWVGEKRSWVVYWMFIRGAGYGPTTLLNHHGGMHQRQPIRAS